MAVVRAHTWPKPLTTSSPWKMQFAWIWISDAFNEGCVNGRGSWVRNVEGGLPMMFTSHSTTHTMLYQKLDCPGLSFQEGTAASADRNSYLYIDRIGVRDSLDAPLVVAEC